MLQLEPQPTHTTSQGSSAAASAVQALRPRCWSPAANVARGAAALLVKVVSVNGRALRSTRRSVAAIGRRVHSQQVAASCGASVPHSHECMMCKASEQGGESEDGLASTAATDGTSALCSAIRLARGSRVSPAWSPDSTTNTPQAGLPPSPAWQRRIAAHVAAATAAVAPTLLAAPGPPARRRLPKLHAKLLPAAFGVHAWPCNTKPVSACCSDRRPSGGGGGGGGEVWPCPPVQARALTGLRPPSGCGAQSNPHPGLQTGPNPS